MARTRIKDNIRESRIFNSRAALALVVVVALNCALIVRLVYLQIIEYDHYTTLADDNRITIEHIPPTRGLIFDRKGRVLAQNLPAFSLEATPEQVKNIDEMLAQLRALINIRDEDIERFRNRLKKKRAFESIPIRTRLNDEEVAIFSVNRHRFPGVDIKARLVRDYPLSESAAHIIGYVGRIDERELASIESANYIATSHIGKIGIEKTYEDTLHGTVGFRHIETNALGRVLREVDRNPPLPGDNIYLSIDIDVQIAAEKALGENRGAVAAIDPRNGEVLALVSTPSFDPNLFVHGIDTKTYSKLNTSLDRPLFNRAIKGQYPPGSTVKPFIGLAGLALQKTTIQHSSFCRGWYTLKNDDHRYRDWKRTGHGHTNLSKAIIESCDVYFYDLALSLGIDNLHDYMSLFGFGARTGIDYLGEASGLMPSREWKRRVHQLPWFPGETLITGIGQGFTLATPLQLAMATATLAAQGIAYQPRIVHATQTAEDASPLRTEIIQLEDKVELAQAHWESTVQAMIDVIHTPKGTAHRIAKDIQYTAAGKTGTAQVFSVAQEEEYDAEELDKRLHDHALFISFAPVEEPRIAVSVVVENGGSGGATAAPIARIVMDTFLNQSQHVKPET